MNRFVIPARVLAVALLGLALVLLAACEPLAGTEQTLPGAAQSQPETSVSTAVGQAESTTVGVSATTGPTTTEGAGGPAAGAGGTPSATTTTTLPKPTPAQPVVTTTSLMLSVITVLTLPADNWVRYEESDPNLEWTGSWMELGAPEASGGSYRTASTKSSCRVSFQGTSLRFVFMVGPDKGKAKVTWDNLDGWLVDLWFQSVQSMNNWSSPELPFGNHTALVEWAGASDSASTGSAIAIDAVEVKGTLVK